ncbi:hypothetical protein HNR42_001445 [Deinobacterium chartae]|uniref:Bax inhibitor-1/YccA family protein n=1 Tax=Deinobacterium chartae TaxID=521158 RepID=A0A841I1T5_9DEIO|nr:Bax inhibitor-1/YccA family protein [Deinobacterium chartae]MBB6098022.1 hypothetical protein [Deinobacterium chartae]
MYDTQRVTASASNLRAFFNRTFTWMAAGLVLTAVVAWYTVSSASLMSFVAGAILPLLLVQLALVFGFGFLLPRVSATVAGVLFAVYSALNGLTLSRIFLVYTDTAIASAFVTAAGMFGAMALIGYTTKVDLTKVGSIAFMALIGLLIAMVVNLFLQSGPLAFIISAVGVIIFAALTAYDIQKLKAIAQYGPAGDGWDGSVGGVSGEVGEKMAVFGALTLYLDFINLFLMLLRLFGFAGGRRE